MTRKPFKIWPATQGVSLKVLLLVSTTMGGETPTGIQGMPPAKGRFVKTDRGFMVPYEAKIPGADVTFEMVPIPGGKFQLGSPAGENGRSENEGPQVEVIIRPFWIGKHEVTWGEYQCYYDLRKVFRKFNDLRIRQVNDDNRADAITAPSTIYEAILRLPPVRDKKTRPKYPAVSMTQYAAKQYTKWLSKLNGDFFRLPSEAEWEYACRAGSTTAFHFGDDPDKLGDFDWFFDNADEQTHPVGEKKPNAWGLYDMHGNVSEWVLDQYDKRGYESLHKSMYRRGLLVRWPTKLHPRSVRGGSWDDEPKDCRSARRLGSTVDWFELEAMIPVSPWWLASDMQSQIGFRIVRPLEVPREAERSKYWDADVEKLRDTIQERCNDLGRGKIGIVDQKLPAAIRRVRKD